MHDRSFNAEHMDRINLIVPKGQKEPIQRHAEAQGESVTAFINRAIREAMAHDAELDKIKKRAKEVGVSLEEALRQFELHRAIRLIESDIPGFEAFYNSGQIPRVIARKVEMLGKEHVTDLYR